MIKAKRWKKNWIIWLYWKWEIILFEIQRFRLNSVQKVGGFLDSHNRILKEIEMVLSGETAQKWQCNRNWKKWYWIRHYRYELSPRLTTGHLEVHLKLPHIPPKVLIKQFGSCSCCSTPTVICPYDWPQGGGLSHSNPTPLRPQRFWTWSSPTHQPVCTYLLKISRLMLGKKDRPLTLGLEVAAIFSMSTLPCVALGKQNKVSEAPPFSTCPKFPVIAPKWQFLPGGCHTFQG